MIMEILLIIGVIAVIAVTLVYVTHKESNKK